MQPFGESDCRAIQTKIFVRQRSCSSGDSTTAPATQRPDACPGVAGAPELAMDLRSGIHPIRQL
eukprot:3003385-Amphidinium_carterae.1